MSARVPKTPTTMHLLAESALCTVVQGCFIDRLRTALVKRGHDQPYFLRSLSHLFLFGYSSAMHESI